MLSLAIIAAIGQTPAHDAKLTKKLEKFFDSYKARGQKLPKQPRLLDYKLNNRTQALTVTVDAAFSEQEFSQEITTSIYNKLKKSLPKPYNKYKIVVVTNGMTIEELIPNRLPQNNGGRKLWGNIDYDGQPWTRNASYPAHITHGLQNRHISIWASHGFYYNQKRNEWQWQRPKLFGTTEDLFTQTIVVPYLIPMLEKAGAVVFTPRERDWQRHEIIIDNDDRLPGTTYIEVNGKQKWRDCGTRGFARHTGNYVDGENPFVAGTARMARTINKKNRCSIVSYQPRIPQEGRYAVYVSYKTLKNSVDDACYTVWHKGGQTDIHVNQQMGGGTWTYLGTFDFDKGCNEFNRVTLTNLSSHKGVVTTDAVRFGGGMGNIERGGTTSGMPRCLEGARYWAQWAGMPQNIYSTKNGNDDYSDDINTRSLMTNYLAGGSCFVPSRDGLGVPIELSLAIHSDAGYAKDETGLIGPLAICTTGYNDGYLNAGISRLASRDFAEALLNNAARDLKYKYGHWNRRELYDRNYSETRLPEVPSAILETMSHQNFPDMLYGQDPNFRFTLARSIYKTILRYISDQHGRSYVVSPLTPDNFSIEFTNKDEIRLSWSAVRDPQEATSQPTGYILYTACGSTGFDNGIHINSSESYKMKLEPGVLYSFRLAAVNRGGESFPTEVLCAKYDPEASGDILIVNGFHRLSSPAVRNNATEQGFDLDDDPGVTLGRTAGWVGRQQVFDRCRMGIEDESGLGWSGNELAGHFIAGNDMNYVRTHAEAIMQSGRYNIVSCSSHAVEDGRINLSRYDMVDLLLGLERDDKHSLVFYKTFRTSMQKHLREYVGRGGKLFVSGSYIGTDMASAEERLFVSDILKCQTGGSNRNCNGNVEGMGTTINFHNTLNETHYAATAPDILHPTGTAFPVMRYSDGHNACVAYKGQDYRTLTMGFPFECITDKNKQASIMRGIINFLLK